VVRAHKGTLDPETRKRVENLLADYQDQVTRNPLEGVFPYPKQHQFLENRSLIKGFIGGNGTGKSLIGTVDDLSRCAMSGRCRSICASTSVGRPRSRCGCRGRMTGSWIQRSWRSSGNSRRATSCSAGSSTRRSTAGPVASGSRTGRGFLFNTFKQDRDSWAGVEVRRTRFDEEPPGEHGYGLFTESMARLRKWTPDAQLSFTMTPLLGLTWVTDQLEREDAWHVTAGMRDNPHIDAESVIASLGHLSAMERKAIIDGLFVHFAGAVVNVTPDHVVPALSPDYLRGKDIYIGIDPGVRGREFCGWCLIAITG
jgi:phage terminase large subunit-like protein